MNYFLLDPRVSMTLKCPRSCSDGAKCKSGLDFATTICKEKLIRRKLSPSQQVQPWDLNLQHCHPALANSSLVWYASGTARGMAPHIRIAGYKVCYSTKCLGLDILAGMHESGHCQSRRCLVALLRLWGCSKFTCIVEFSSTFYI